MYGINVRESYFFVMMIRCTVCTVAMQLWWYVVPRIAWLTAEVKVKHVQARLVRG